jgi:P-type Ca2+ transporter type 2C
MISYFQDQQSPDNYEKAITITFISVIFGQFANLLSRRTYGNALGKYLFSNRKLLLAFAFSISCILLIVYVPLLNLYFHTSPLNVADWLLPLAAGFICLFLYETRKKINQHLNQRRALKEQSAKS